MSMAAYEPDWDASTETRYEAHLLSVASGLCLVCGEDESLPNGDFCQGCVEELDLEEVDE